MTTALPDQATLTVTEVAQILRIHRDAAYDAIHRSDIPSLRVGRTIRIPTARLADLLGLPLPLAPEPEKPRSDCGYETGRSAALLT